MSQELLPGFSAKSDDSIHRDGTSLTHQDIDQALEGVGGVQVKGAISNTQLGDACDVPVMGAISNTQLNGSNSNTQLNG